MSKAKYPKHLLTETTTPTTVTADHVTERDGPATVPQDMGPDNRRLALEQRILFDAAGAAAVADAFDFDGDVDGDRDFMPDYGPQSQGDEHDPLEMNLFGGDVGPLGEDDGSNDLLLTGDGSLNEVLEGQGTLPGSEAAFLTSDMLSASAGDVEASDIIYTLTQLPETGNLRLTDDTTGTSILLGLHDTFTQADIDAGRVSFHHSGGDDLFTDQFEFSVSTRDNPEDTTVGSLDIFVTPQNDTPNISHVTITVSENNTVLIGTGHIHLYDADRPAEVGDGIDETFATQNDLWFTITRPAEKLIVGNQSPGQAYTHVGVLQWKADDGTWIDITSENLDSFNDQGGRITMADLSSGRLRYQHNGSEDFSDEFYIHVSISTSASRFNSGVLGFCSKNLMLSNRFLE